MYGKLFGRHLPIRYGTPYPNTHEALFIHSILRAVLALFV